MSEQWDVRKLNGNTYHGDSWRMLAKSSSWKDLFIALIRALLAIDVRLAELVELQRESISDEQTNNRIARFAKQIQQGKRK